MRAFKGKPYPGRAVRAPAPRGAGSRRLRAALFACALAWLSGCGAPPTRIVSPELTDAGVVFRYRDPVAQVVQLSGSWETNFHLRGRDWTSNTRVGRMRRGKNGVWELTVALGPGRYEYVFLVDGRFWRLDPDNPQRSPDGADGWASLLVVP